MNEIERLQTLVAQLADKDRALIELSLWSPITHQSNHIYRIRFDNTQWIGKVFLKPEEFDDAPRREFAAMQLLAPLDIAPQPIHYEKHRDDEKPIVIYEFMEGDMWNRNSPTAYQLNQLATMWLQMNNAKIDNLWLSRGMKRGGEQIAEQFASRFQNYADWTEAHFPEGQRAAKALLRVAKKRLGIMDELFGINAKLCFSRADPRFANVIARPDGHLGMIDWEDSGLRDAARDVADVMVHANQEDLLTWEEWQAFLEPYFAERKKFDADIEKRVDLYQAVFPLFWLSGLLTLGLMRWEREQLAEWTINSMNPNPRLRRYLARAMAWPKIEFETELADVQDLVFFDV